VNAAKRLLRSAGLGQLGRSLASETGWEKLERALKEKDETLAMYIGQHRTVWRSARDQVDALGTSAQGAARPLCWAARATTDRTGRGPIVATTAVAVFSDVGRFATAKEALV
jgi:hypothetical protein